jgi:hypothetical protein
VQRVKPTLEGLRLWPRHGDDDARLRDGAADLQRGMSSSTAWTSTGRRMRTGQERASYTNRQHAGVSLIETRAGFTATDS